MKQQKLKNNEGIEMDYFCCIGCGNWIVLEEKVEDSGDTICPLCAIRRGKLTIDQFLERFA